MNMIEARYSLLGTKTVDRTQLYNSMDGLFRHDVWDNRYPSPYPDVNDLAFSYQADTLADEKTLNKAANTDLWMRSQVFRRIFSYKQYEQKHDPDMQYRVVANLDFPVGIVHILRNNLPGNDLFENVTHALATHRLSDAYSGESLEVISIVLKPFMSTQSGGQKESITIYGRHPSGRTITNVPYSSWNNPDLQSKIGYAFTYAYTDPGLLSGHLHLTATHNKIT